MVPNYTTGLEDSRSVLHDIEVPRPLRAVCAAVVRRAAHLRASSACAAPHREKHLRRRLGGPAPESGAVPAQVGQFGVLLLRSAQSQVCQMLQDVRQVQKMFTENGKSVFMKISHFQNWLLIFTRLTCKPNEIVLRVMHVRKHVITYEENHM